MIENVIINSTNVLPTDSKTLFGDEVVHTTDVTDFPSLLVEMGIFKSKSQARQAGRIGPIPVGWTHEFKASKKRRLWIWNPSD